MFVWLAPSLSWTCNSFRTLYITMQTRVRTVVLQANRPASWLSWEKSQRCSGWDQKSYKSNSPFCLRVSVNLLEDSDFIHPRQAEILTRRQSPWVSLHRYQGQQWRVLLGWGTATVYLAVRFDYLSSFRSWPLKPQPEFCSSPMGEDGSLYFGIS